ncbi:MAG TPA: hypothetical protein VF682_24090 [Pseudomonas sp.]|jgi:hypothetical protein
MLDETEKIGVCLDPRATIVAEQEREVEDITPTAIVTNLVDLKELNWRTCMSQLGLDSPSGLPANEYLGECLTQDWDDY